MITLTKNSVLLDIETSGLKRQTDLIISIGVLVLDHTQKPMLKHWFLEKDSDEKSLLEHFLTFVKDYQIIYTYYGKGFDYPFLLSRMAIHGLDTTNFLKLQLIDIKDALKHFESQRTSLEKALHFERQSTIQSKEVIKLYKTYAASNEPIYRSLILQHQEDELHSLLAFLELYRTLMFSSQALGFHTAHTEEQLAFKLEFSEPFHHTFAGKAFDWQFSYEKGTTVLLIFLPLINASLKQYLEPAKDYYYISSQSQVIHKSLAQFIPSALKRRATKEECTVFRASTYLRIYTTYKLTAPVWYDSQKNIYLDRQDFTPEILVHQLFHLFFQNNSKAKTNKKEDS